MKMSFASDIQFVCLVALIALLIYTLWLSRYRGLDTHVTVRWVLMQGAAIVAIVLWQWLPFFDFTSKLQDRQLLLVMMVMVFAFVAFLMLDLLVRVSRQSVQIKKLVQELAIQRMRLDTVVPPEVLIPREDVAVVPPVGQSPKSALLSGTAQMLFLGWLVVVLALNGMLVNEPLARWVVYKVAPEMKAEWTLKPLLTASYQN
jgi:hypothetical protein